MKASKLRKKQKQASLKPRCLAKFGEYICERELGHGNGWNGDKHRQGGVSWTDAAARDNVVSQNETIRAREVPKN